MLLISTKQARELNRAAIEEQGVDSLELMENAAQKVARQLHLMLQKEGRSMGKGVTVGAVLSKKESEALTEQQLAQVQRFQQTVQSRSSDPTRRVAVFCGTGNNGGDGIAAARLLMEMGYTVRAFLVGPREKMTPDARAMEEKLCLAGGTLERFSPEDPEHKGWLMTCDGVVDAIFGVGLSRAVEGEYLQAIQWINHVRSPWRPVVSCDVPSGVDADTGAVLGQAVRASATVTFTCAKPGLYQGEGGVCAGKVRVESIGIPHELVWKLERAEDALWAMDAGHYVLPRRPAAAHKGDFGKVFILAGSEGYTGAPVLAAKAAARMGAGLVYLYVPREIYPIVAVKCDEPMVFPLPEQDEEVLRRARECDVALIGPGLGRSQRAARLCGLLLEELDIPVVLDADGINLTAGHIDRLKRRGAPTILTPHEGEFRRLTGCELPLPDRQAAARRSAREWGCTVVLKGHATVTAAPGGKGWICGAGNPGMARGGSGDVLAGMIAGLLGQKHLSRSWEDLPELTAWAVYYHAQAGDRCADEMGEYAMLPSQLLDSLPQVLREHQMKE